MKSIRPLLLAPAALAAAIMVSPLLAAPPAVSGDVLFKQRCQSCHKIGPQAASPLGPNLSGVVGRKAGSTSFRYSPALQSSKIVWSRENLDRYLTGPAKMVPGTRMVISVSDAAQRAELIKFLETAR